MTKGLGCNNVSATMVGRITLDGEPVAEVRVPTFEDFVRLRRVVLKILVLLMVSTAVLGWHIVTGLHVAPPVAAEVAQP